MMKVLVGYPSEEEFVIVERVTGDPVDAVPVVATTEQLQHAAAECRRVYADPSAGSSTR